MRSSALHDAKPIDTIAKRRDLPLPSLTAFGAVVGVIGGLGAWAFRLMIGVVHNLAFAGRFDPVYDASRHTPSFPWGPAVVAVPVIGSAIVVYLVNHHAPEARGHGVPEVIDAVYYRSGVIRPVVAVVKAVASSISIGTGGSVGREGPIVQIGSAFGSTIGQYRHLSVQDTQLLIAAGSAAGIAATFNAPVGGVLFAVELLLVSVSARSLLAVGIAVASGVSVARGLLGSTLSFDILDLQHVAPIQVGWAELAAVLALGIAAGIISAGFIRGLYAAEDRFARIRNPYLAHALGMSAVGVLIAAFHARLGVYAVEGVGYATIIDILGNALTSPWTLLALAAGKMLATFSTLGSGASGGVFSPMLFIGAAAGAMTGQALAALGLPVDPSVVALAGMAAVVAGSTGAVVTGVVMVTELTGDFGAAVPLLVAAVIALTVRRRLVTSSIYTEKLRRRGRWVPTGLRAAGIDAIRARDLAHPPGETVEHAPSVQVGGDASMFDVIAALDTRPVIGVAGAGGTDWLIERSDVESAIERLAGEQWGLAAPRLPTAGDITSTTTREKP